MPSPADFHDYALLGTKVFSSLLAAPGVMYVLYGLGKDVTPKKMATTVCTYNRFIVS
jgi:hypothetical protein